MIRQEIKNLTEKAVKDLYKKEVGTEIERPTEPDFGDYSTNIAMVLKKDPQEIAKNIKSDILEKIEVKNGFINFFLSKEYLQKQVGEILKEGERFGEFKIGKGKKVNIEFISANPTGPLTLGNGRGGFCGDVLANVLKKAGYKVKREYYINDVGEQIRKLGHSVLGDSEAVYKGSYIEDLRKRVNGNNPDKVGETAAKIILEEKIKPGVKEMGIEFDAWFSEKSLHEKKEVKNVLDYLKKNNLSYEKEEALWFKSTDFGDDKDRVLIKADGEKTYFLSDIAYLKNKFRRGFQKLIFFWGADHYGYINRIKAATEALGYKKEQLDIIIMQLVRLFEGGKEIRMSKRTGIYVTIDELINEVGLDVSRFFFLMRSPGSHLLFDLDLAKQQSEKNPVFYVQYAHARIYSIIKKINTKDKIQDTKYELLIHPSELTLIKQLIRFPEIIEDTAKDYQVQRLPQYVLDLATVFHQFYRDCKVLTETRSLSEARLGLVSATKIVFKNTLNLMGISAPEKM
jgi:arginyl-tRNA synthetase